MVTAGAAANTTEVNSRASKGIGVVVFTFTRGIYRYRHAARGPVQPSMPSHTLKQLLSRRRGHLHARALQIRAVLSTHIHTEQGSRPSIGESVCLSVRESEGGGDRLTSLPESERSSCREPLGRVCL